MVKVNFEFLFEGTHSHLSGVLQLRKYRAVAENHKFSSRLSVFAFICGSHSNNSRANFEFGQSSRTHHQNLLFRWLLNGIRNYLSCSSDHVVSVRKGMLLLS